MNVPSVVNSIVVVSALTRCALPYSVGYMTAAQMNEQQHSLIQELIP